MFQNTSIQTPSELEPVGPQCVLSLIRQVLPADSRDVRLRWNDRLSDLGITSLRLLSLIMDLEERFDLSIDALTRLSINSTLGTVMHVCLETEAACEDATTIH